MKQARVVFTQPPAPIKCAGAPQKAMYLSADAWRRAGVLDSVEIEFCSAAPSLFGVPDYVPALMECVERYGIHLNFEETLVSVEGQRKRATFRRASGPVPADWAGYSSWSSVKPRELVRATRHRGATADDAGVCRAMPWPWQFRHCA